VPIGKRVVKDSWLVYVLSETVRTKRTDGTIEEVAGAQKTLQVILGWGDLIAIMTHWGSI